MQKLATIRMLVAAVILCAGIGTWATAQDKPEVVEVTGILVKVSAVAADTTGWELHFPNSTDVGGKMTKAVELDGDPRKFQKLENLRITVKGYLMRPTESRVVIKVQKIKEGV